MKKLFTSLALVFALLGLSVGVLTGCGSTDDWAKAEKADPAKVSTIFEAANYFEEGYAAKITMNGETVLEATYVEKLVNEGADDKKSVLEAKIKIDFPKELAGEQAMKMNVYIKDEIIFVETETSKTYKAFDAETDQNYLMIADVLKGMVETPKFTLDQFTANEDATLKQIDDEKNGVYKFQGTFAQETDENNHGELKLTGHFKKNSEDIYDFTYVCLEEKGVSEGKPVTATYVIETVTEVDFSGTGIENVWIAA